MIVSLDITQWAGSTLYFPWVEWNLSVSFPIPEQPNDLQEILGDREHLDGSAVRRAIGGNCFNNMEANHFTPVFTTFPASDQTVVNCFGLRVWPIRLSLCLGEERELMLLYGLTGCIQISLWRFVCKQAQTEVVPCFCTSLACPTFGNSAHKA